ncbi:type IV secretion system DNA-binding domain-containing protein, partial [Klebsiella pneumoniae]|uniref:type IV secretion system DNA-binding domain-containing protein n=1 Tax=Klebsiella pneumoniae TaxID=573 RepID=UPI001D0ED078
IRGGKNIALDPNGGFLKNFYRPGDVISNAYDKRTEGWVFFNEIRRSYDYERLVNSIVRKALIWLLKNGSAMAVLFLVKFRKNFTAY